MDMSIIITVGFICFCTYSLSILLYGYGSDATIDERIQEKELFSKIQNFGFIGFIAMSFVFIGYIASKKSLEVGVPEYDAIYVTYLGTINQEFRNDVETMYRSDQQITINEFRKLVANYKPVFLKHEDDALDMWDYFTVKIERSKLSKTYSFIYQLLLFEYVFYFTLILPFLVILLNRVFLEAKAQKYSKVEIILLTFNTLLVLSVLVAPLLC